MSLSLVGLTYVYTGDGQLYSIEDSKTGYKYTYTYDSIGRLIASSVRDGTGITFLQTRQEYNNLNQLIKQTWQVGSTVYTESYTYEAADGALNSYTNALGQSIDLTYDGLQRVEKVDTPLLDRTYTYLNVANSTTKTTGLVSGYTYKNSAGTALFTYGYTYDSVGNIATYNQNGTTWTYTYDAQNQLISAASGSTTYSYSYDNVGNITSANGKSYTYGNTVWRDLLTKYDGQYIAYEGQTVSGSTVSGNPTSGNPISYYNGTRWTFDWEEGRNLVSADSTSASVDYAYDQNGLRVSKTVDGVKHTYLYASGKLLRESYGTVVLDFFYDQSGYPYAMTYKNGTAAAVTYYYITNLQGDVLTMITSTGTSVASYTYDPYGKPLTATGTMATINPLRYRGYYYDTETGFYYLQSRYYDPTICRFINADSYASTGQGVLGNNMFAYCNNNPVMSTDIAGCIPSDSKVAYALSEGLGRCWYILNQNTCDFSNWIMGESTVGKSGCGIVATYNALISLGETPNFYDIYHYFTSDLSRLADNGKSGISIYALEEYFASLGYDASVTFLFIDESSQFADAAILLYSRSSAKGRLFPKLQGGHFVEYSWDGEKYTARNCPMETVFDSPEAYGNKGNRLFPMALIIYKDTGSV